MFSVPDPRNPENDAQTPQPSRQQSDPPSEPGGHYFTATPTTRHNRRVISVQLPDVQFELTTDAGVFSPDALDRGTKYLLQELPNLPAGPYLDLGCGYGPIALTLAQRYPEAEVTAVDVNERALLLTRENAKRLGRSLRVQRANDLDPQEQFGAIVSNPPIRIGKNALHDLLHRHLSMLRQPDGVAYLVVHKHLGADSLSRWLNEQGFPTKKVGSRKGFRLLRVTSQAASNGETQRDQSAIEAGQDPAQLD